MLDASSPLTYVNNNTTSCTHTIVSYDLEKLSEHVVAQESHNIHQWIFSGKASFMSQVLAGLAGNPRLKLVADNEEVDEHSAWICHYAFITWIVYLNIGY